MRARSQCRVADDSLGVGVPMVSISINDAGLPQVAEAAFAEAIVKARRQIATQLVDRDLQDQFGLVARIRCDGKKQSRN